MPLYVDGVGFAELGNFCSVPKILLPTFLYNGLETTNLRNTTYHYVKCS